MVTGAKHQYFKEETEGLGAASLVANSQFHHLEFMKSIPRSEVRLHMNIAKHVNGLSAKQRGLFADIVDDLVKAV